MSFANANLPIQKFIQAYGNTGRTYQVIDFVRKASAANTTIDLDTTTFLKAPGKKRSVIINYWPILCDVDGSCSANICDTGDAVEPAQQIFEITKCVASKVYRVEKDSVRLTDSGEWDFTGIANAIIKSILPTMRRTLATEWLTNLYDMSGIHLDGNSTKRVTTTNNANGVVNPIGRFDINREYKDGGFAEPFVIGGTEVYNWQNMVNIGGLNASGQNIGQLSTANSWYDDGLSESILADTANGDHILAVDPQVFKYIYYLENAGIFRTTMTSQEDFNSLFLRGSETVLNGTLVDPVTGIPWDLDIYYSPCGKFWNFQIRHRYDFFLMPDIACNIQGVNGIMHYRTCPQIQVQCPSGSPISSPVAATTYNWNPSFSYPLLVSHMVLGGVETNPNVTVTTDAELVAMLNENYAPGQGIFTLNGSNVRYSGYTALTGELNEGDVTITFA